MAQLNEITRYLINERIEIVDIYDGLVITKMSETSYGVIADISTV